MGTACPHGLFDRISAHSSAWPAMHECRLVTLMCVEAGGVTMDAVFMGRHGWDGILLSRCASMPQTEASIPSSHLLQLYTAVFIIYKYNQGLYDGSGDHNTESTKHTIPRFGVKPNGMMSNTWFACIHNEVCVA